MQIAFIDLNSFFIETSSNSDQISIDIAEDENSLLSAIIQRPVFATPTNMDLTYEKALQLLKPD